MVRERFCWPNRKVAIHVMCCEEVQRGLKGTYSPVFLGRHQHICVCHKHTMHMHFDFFADKSGPKTETVLINF